MKRLLAALALTIATSGLAVTQPLCMTWDLLTLKLDAADMRLAGTAMSNDTPPFGVQWWVSPAGRWVVIYTNDVPNMTCVIAGGLDFEFVEWRLGDDAEGDGV